MNNTTTKVISNAVTLVAEAVNALKSRGYTEAQIMPMLPELASKAMVFLAGKR